MEALRILSLIILYDCIVDDRPVYKSYGRFIISSIFHYSIMFIVSSISSLFSLHSI
jgi:hypothetical protein